MAPHTVGKCIPLLIIKRYVRDGVVRPQPIQEQWQGHLARAMHPHKSALQLSGDSTARWVIRTASCSAPGAPAALWSQYLSYDAGGGLAIYRLPVLEEDASVAAICVCKSWWTLLCLQMFTWTGLCGSVLLSMMCVLSFRDLPDLAMICYPVAGQWPQGWPA